MTAAAIAAKPIYQPAPVQQEFHVCPANEILLGGAAGPGKSLALLMDPIQTQLMTEHQRWVESRKRYLSTGWAIHFRREFPRLEQTIERSHRMFKALDPKTDGNPGAQYDSQKHTWTFSCGYKLQFAHVKHDDDMYNYMSSEYSHIAWDELSEMSQAVYDFVNTRLRSSDPVLQNRLRIVAASNPAGNWVRDYFVAPAPEGRKLLLRSIPMNDGTIESRTRIFIPATLKDNPDAGFRRRYELELQDKPPHIRKALLYGDWWVVHGAFFADTWVKNIHEVEPFKVPSGWTRFRAMDWGHKSPGSVGWYAVDTDENLVKYRELTFQGLDAGEVARKIRKIEQDADEWDEGRDCSRLSGPADTQIWSVTGTIGPTIAETMADEGVYWEKCTKNKLAAVMQLVSRLKDHGNDSSPPGFRVFKTCKNTIRTIPSIGTDKSNPELPDDSPGVEDHWLDETLYACMYRMKAAKSDERDRKRDRYDELGELRRKKRRHGGGGGWGYGM